MVTKTMRERLLDSQSDGDTYSDQIRSLVPEPDEGDVLECDTETVSLSLDDESYRRVSAHAGNGVPLRRVIEFYYYLDVLDASTSPEEILREVYVGEQIDGDTLSEATESEEINTNEQPE